MPGRDSLTGLAGRQAFCSEVDEQLRAGGGRVVVEVVLFGLDDFMDVNCAFGYDTGDALLIAVSQKLTATQTSKASVSRSGGDVFALIRSHPGPPDAGSPPAAVTEITDLLGDPFMVDGVPVKLGATFGIASSGDSVLRGDQLLRRAEIALFRAKRTALRWAIFDEQTDEPAATRLIRVTELRQALSRRELQVHYQPVVDLRTGKVRSVEALARWNSPEHGMVMPGDFIGLAEQSGLIMEVTTYVIQSAAEQLRRWAGQGRRLHCAVNVSPRCLADETYASWLVGELSGLDGLITVEVTESMLVDRRAVAALRRLQEAGVACAVDDFGTGFSSLAHLRNLPVDALKIDRAFLAGIGDDDRAMAVIQTIVALGQALSLEVVAEGIETESVARRLRRAGVDSAQGYWFARPMPAGALEGWLDATRPQTFEAIAAEEDIVVPIAPHDHLVFFYDHERELIAEMATFVTDSLTVCGNAIVIATPQHRHALRQALPVHLLSDAVGSDRYVDLDAAECLNTFMRDGLPDAELFDAVIGRRIRSHAIGRTKLYAYGEMVALLWADGNVIGALELENMWNRLQQDSPFTLLCAYPRFDAEAASSAGFVQICSCHSRAYTASDPHQTANAF